MQQPDTLTSLPPVPLTRLRTLVPAEHALYFDLFLAAGGGPDKPAAEGAVSVLARSRLPEWLLQKVWAFADEFNTGVLDLEAFCVACRLCAHAQQASEEIAEQVVGAAAAAEVPSSPPWFEGYERSEEGAASRQVGSTNELGRSYAQATSATGIMPGGRAGNGNFDFEAVAFGSGAGGPIDSARPGSDVGLGAALVLPTGIPSVGGQWQRASSSAGGGAGSRAGEVDDVPSTAILAKGLGLRLPDQVPSGIAAGHTAHRRGKHDPVKRLGEELLEGRQKLEQSLADKRRLQRQHDKVAQKAESIRNDREKIVAELTVQQCDMEHNYTQLDFSRQQIEAVQREIAHLERMRQAFSQDDFRHMQRTRSRFEGERLSLGEDRHDAKASMQMSQDMLQQDRKHVDGLVENAKRAERRKMELQSKQNILLEEQRQAEQERSAMLYALELERVKLHSIRSERLDIGKNARKVLEEAKKLAHDTGAEPGVFADCFLPRSSEPQEKVPRDPLALPPSGAWGPAADYARSGEDPSSWKKAVYRHGADRSDRFSVSGGNIDLASMPPWSKFSGEGAQRGAYGGGRDRGFNHLSNAGFLGVPAGGQENKIVSSDFASR